MLDLWLDLPVWGVFAVLAFVLSLTAFLINRACFGKSSHQRALPFTGVVAPFFGSVAILFSLLTGFLANEVWERNRQAHRIVVAERDNLLALHAISIATVADMEPIRETARRYARVLIDDEWPRMLDQESSPAAEAALLTLLAQVSNPAVGVAVGDAAQGALFDTVLALRKARSDRLALSGDRTDRTKWAAVFLLAIMTQIAIAVVHLERPRAQVAALSIFSLSVVIALGLVAIRESPFDGALRYSADPIADALATISAPSKP